MTSLWAHQKRGVELISHARATLLHWDMRTGKSRAVVEYVCQARPALSLILCPKSVIEVWPNEFYKFSLGGADAVYVLAPTKGTVAKRLQYIRDAFTIEKKMTFGKPLIVVVNHESAWRKPMGQAFLQVPWDLVVVDEGHRMKSPGGKFSRWCARLSQAAPKAKRVILTGTPMPHSPLDIFAQARFLDPYLFSVDNDMCPSSPDGRHHYGE